MTNVILSCNEDPTYRDFWPIVADAYSAMGFRPHLAFLTDRPEFDDLIVEYRKHGQVTMFRPVPDIPEFGQAKMIRFILASMQGWDDECYVDDIDLYPLSRDFIIDKLKRRPAKVLLCVGGEVYNFNGCYPVSQMTAEGNVWRRFINPCNLDYATLIRSWKGKYFYDRREDISIPVVLDERGGYKDDYYFSDERLIKRLLVESPVPKLEIQRGYSDYLEATLDRATVKDGVWHYDVEKLRAGQYVNAHGARPYEQYKEYYAPLIEYVKENYGKV